MLVSYAKSYCRSLNNYQYYSGVPSNYQGSYITGNDPGVWCYTTSDVGVRAEGFKALGLGLKSSLGFWDQGLGVLGLGVSGLGV